MAYIMDWLQSLYEKSYEEERAITDTFNGAEYTADAMNAVITTTSTQPPHPENGECPAFWVKLANQRLAIYGDPTLKRWNQELDAMVARNRRSENEFRRRITEREDELRRVAD